MLVLASRSPRRRALLRAAGIPFRVIAPGAEDELPSGRISRHARFVQQVALAKARQVARKAPGPVLAADTIVVCGGRALGKPADREDARRMLRLLSGRTHRVYTGVALVQGERCLVSYERTQVQFRRLSERDIERYIASREPMGKAGAYAIQGLGAALIAEVRGCYANVIGLPLPRVLAMLGHFGLLGAGSAGRGGRRCRKHRVDRSPRAAASVAKTSKPSVTLSERPGHRDSATGRPATMRGSEPRAV